MPPRVLLLSATTGYQLRSFNDAAERLGVSLTVASDRCHALDDPWQDRALAVRFDEIEGSTAVIAEAARQERFAGVIAVGDRPVHLAAAAAARLGLPWHGLEAVAASGDKLTARRRCAAAGLPTPWFFAVAPRTDAAEAAADPRLAFPCVLKPTGLSGSRGVIRADTPAEFGRALERIRRLLARPDVRASRRGTGDMVLAEGFIEGREIALEGVVSRGTLQIFAIFDKPDPLDGPFFEETIYVTPPLRPLNEPAVAAAIQAAVTALGLSHGPVHAECRVGPAGVTVLEIAARPIGGLCARVVRLEDPEGTTGALEDVLLRHALGEDVRQWRQASRPAAVMMVPIPARGHLKTVEGVSDAAAVAGVEAVQVTAKAGQLLEPLPEAGSYLGFIFARAETPALADAAVREAHRHLRVVIAPAIDVRRQ